MTLTELTAKLPAKLSVRSAQSRRIKESPGSVVVRTQSPLPGSDRFVDCVPGVRGC